MWSKIINQIKIPREKGRIWSERAPEGGFPSFRTLGVSLQGCWVRGKLRAALASGHTVDPHSASPASSFVPFLEWSCQRLQCKKELYVINKHRICKLVCLKQAGELAQAEHPKRRLGNCLLKLAPLPFWRTNPPQQLCEKVKSMQRNNSFYLFHLNIVKSVI